MKSASKYRLGATALLITVASVMPTVADAAPAKRAPDPILFMGTRGGNSDLYVASAQGVSAKKIVSNPGHDCGPAARPGPVKEIAFATMRDDGSADLGGHFQIYKMDALSGKVRRLTTPGQPASLADQVNPDDAPTLGAHNLGPTWSPDGKQIAFSSTRNGSVGTPNWPIADGEIWVMNADGSKLRQLTSVDGAQTHSFPAWSPDGKWIAFQVTRKTEPARPSIYAVRPNGEGMHILQYDALYPSWSPDSTRIAFSSGRAGLPNDQDLYIMDADGSNARRLSSYIGAEFMPSWSPDGKRIVYVHDPDGWTDIAVVLLLPTGQTQDVYSSGTETSSVWVADLKSNGGAYKIAKRERRTSGGNDLFPKFAPSWLR